jgi:hypothetical protein
MAGAFAERRRFLLCGTPALRTRSSEIWAAKTRPAESVAAVRVPPKARYRSPPDQPSLAPENFTTFAHLSVLSATTPEAISFSLCSMIRLGAMVRRTAMTRNVTVAALAMLTAISAAFAAGEQTKFSCSGEMLEPNSLAPSPKSIQLTLSSANKVAVGNSNARVLSDNKIQLKFQTKEFVGEFFHYTNDLFLIYKSGHLARLTCNRG